MFFSSMRITLTPHCCVAVIAFDLQHNTVRADHTHFGSGGNRVVASRRPIFPGNVDAARSRHGIDIVGDETMTTDKRPRPGGYSGACEPRDQTGAERDERTRQHHDECPELNRDAEPHERRSGGCHSACADERRTEVRDGNFNDGGHQRHREPAERREREGPHEADAELYAKR